MSPSPKNIKHGLGKSLIFFVFFLKCNYPFRAISVARDDAMTTVLLVHGTFAPDAGWTKEESSLRRCFEAEFVKRNRIVKFLPIEWSGRNRFTDRLAGAKLIESAVRNLRSKNDEENIIIVAHSHGGNSVAYFLKQHDEALRSVQGAIFLSTPFISLRAKSDTGLRVKIYCYFSLLVAQIGLLLATQQLSEWFHFTADGFYLMLFLNVLFGAFLVHSYRTFGFFDRLIERKRNEIRDIIRSQDSCHLPDGNYLFMKFSGDEALFGLSSAQAVSYALNWIVERVYGVTAALISRAASNRMVGREIVELCMIFIVSIWLLFSPSIVGYTLTFEQVANLAYSERQNIEEELKSEISAQEESLLISNRRIFEVSRSGDREDARRHFRELFDENDAIVEVLKNKKAYLAQLGIDNSEFIKFHIVTFLKRCAIDIAYLFLILSGIMALIYICLLAFGSIRLTELLYIESSVEVVPYGAHTLVLLNWKDIKDRSRNFRHSAIYSSSAALETISAWLAKNHS